MNIKCPCCGTLFRVEVNAETTYTEDENDIFDSLKGWLKGYKPYKDRFEKIEDFKYKFHIQTYDSPEGDIWVHGIVRWIPGEKPEILEKDYSEY